MKPTMSSQGLKVLTREIVPIYEYTNGKKVVLGRDLHKALELKTPYSLWTNQTALRKGEKDVDYWTFKNGQQKEHLISLDMALKIAKVRDPRISRKVSRRLYETSKGNYDPVDFDDLKILDNKPIVKPDEPKKPEIKNQLTLFSNNMVPVYTTEKGNKVVLGRELHKALGSKDNYTNWFKRMSEYEGFIENETYFKIFQNRSDGLKGKPRQDHIMTLRMAQHIAMLQNSLIGYQIRDYLLNLENNLALKNINPSFMIDDPAERARRWADEYEERKLLEHQLKEAQPKIDFANALEESKGCISVGDLAKILTQNGIPMGRNRLFQWFRDNGYLIKQKGTDFNMPTQKSIEKSLFEIVPYLIQKPNGENEERKGVKVTPRGQSYFIQKFLKMKKDTQ